MGANSWRLDHRVRRFPSTQHMLTKYYISIYYTWIIITITQQTIMFIVFFSHTCFANLQRYYMFWMLQLYTLVWPYVAIAYCRFWSTLNNNDHACLQRSNIDRPELYNICHRIRYEHHRWNHSTSGGYAIWWKFSNLCGMLLHPVCGIRYWKPHSVYYSIQEPEAKVTCEFIHHAPLHRWPDRHVHHAAIGNHLGNHSGLVCR